MRFVRAERKLCFIQISSNNSFSLNLNANKYEMQASLHHPNSHVTNNNFSIFYIILYVSIHHFIFILDEYIICASISVVHYTLNAKQYFPPLYYCK